MPGGDDRFWTRVLIALAVSLATFRVQADPTLHPISFLQTVQNPHHFSEVERIARNHDVGEYRGGELNLRRYVQITEGAYLGIDESGSLFQVFELERRTVAFLMSGRRRLVDLFFAPERALVAIDDDGQVLSFDLAQWLISPRGGIVRRHAGAFGAALVPVGAIGWWTSAATGIPLTEMITPFAALVIGGGVLQSLVGMMEYSEKNNDTDGLRPIGYRVEGFRRAEDHFDRDTGARDYVLESARGAESLIEILASRRPLSARIFDRPCEDRLARGLPPWTPFRPDDGDLGPPAARRNETPELRTHERPRLLGRRD